MNREYAGYRVLEIEDFIEVREGIAGEKRKERMRGKYLFRDADYNENDKWYYLAGKKEEPADKVDIYLNNKAYNEKKREQVKKQLRGLFIA